MPHRVLHVLDHSWPVVDGYSLRSRNIVAAQSRLGAQPCVLTGPLHELDDGASVEAVFDGIPYRRTPLRGRLAKLAIGGRWPVLREAEVAHLLCQRIRSLIDRERFHVVHAHSPALCGLAAWWATKSRRIPFVYEIRGFWEDAAVNQKKTRQGSLRYGLSRSLEGLVVRRADAVVGIAFPILEDLRGRGISPEKLFHIPNGVDANQFFPRARDTELAAQLGLNKEPTLGFIGTLFRWEGLSWLVSAAAELRRRGASFKLLIVGSGEEAAEIKAGIREANAEDYILFLGQVPHDQVQRYYSVMDILVYPRPRMRLTELVTPLKPLEAMAQGKAIVASNVGGIRELIEPDGTGVLFEPNDLEDFCRKTGQLLQDEDWRRALGERARQTILQEKDWKILARRYEDVYESAIRNARSSSLRR